MSYWGPWYGATEAVATPTPTPPTPAGAEVLYLMGVGGVLWAQTPTGGVVSYSGAPSTEVFSMRVMTGPVRSAATPLSWGRLRGVGVRGKSLAAHTQQVRVLAEDTEVEIADKQTAMVADSPVNWPNTRTAEVRTSTQRCSVFKVELTAYPAVAEWTSIDAWVSGTQDRAPSRNRS